MPSPQSRRRRALARAKAWLAESQGSAVVPKDKRTISQLETIRLPASVEKRVVEEQVQGNRRRAAHGTFGFSTNFGKVHRFFNDRSNRRRSARLPQSFAALEEEKKKVKDGYAQHASLENKSAFVMQVGNTSRHATKSSYVPMMKEHINAREMRERNKKRLQRKHAKTPIEEQDFMANVKGGRLRTRSDYDVEMSKFKKNEDIIMDVMMEVDGDELRHLKRGFKKHDNELTRTEFVDLMLRYVPYDEEDPAEELKLVSNLCELFDQIDVNGDGTMEWEEFTSYIVDSSQDRHHFRVDNIKKYNLSHVIDNTETMHSAMADCLQYLKDCDRLVVCERESKAFRVYDPSNGHLVKTVHGHKGVVLCAEEIPERDYVVTASTDLTIAFWDTDKYIMRQQMPTPEVQMCLEWAGAKSNSTLYSGGVSGVVNVWDVDQLTVKGKLRGHTETVMDLHRIPFMEVLTTASLDAQIHLFDMQTGVLRQSLQGHAKGVFSLSYTPEYRFLVSSGFDHDALVWNPYVENLICRLQGHTSSLVGVEFIENTPEIITASEDGVVKIWDIRNFSCVQTLNTFEDDVSDGEGHLSSFTYAGKHKRIVAGSRSLHFFDYDQPADPHLTDQFPVVEAIYNETTETFITAAGKNVKIWDARSGRLLRIYRDLCKSELTALCIDDRQRKFITGDHDGNVVVYSYSNGARMKNLISHGGEVSGLQYSPTGNKHVISISWDGSLLIQDESDPERGTLVLRVFHMDGVMQAQDRTPRRLRVKVGEVEWSGLGVGASSKSSHIHNRSTSSYSLSGTKSGGNSGGGGDGEGGDGSTDTAIAADPGNTTGGNSNGNREEGSSGAQTQQQRHRSMRSMTKQPMAKNRWGSTPNMMPGSMPRPGPAEVPKVEVNAFALSDNLSLFVTGGGSDKSICVWDKESGKPDGVCLGHTAEVNALIFLDPYPAFVSADVAGNLCLWATRPSHIKHYCLLRFKNTDAEGNKIAVTTMAWHDPSKVLFTGDEKGWVKAWELRRAILKLRLQPFLREKMEKAMEASMGVGKSFTQLLRERQAGGVKGDGKDGNGGEKESLFDVFRREGRALTMGQYKDNSGESVDTGRGKGKTTTLSGTAMSAAAKFLDKKFASKIRQSIERDSRAKPSVNVKDVINGEIGAMDLTKLMDQQEQPRTLKRNMSFIDSSPNALLQVVDTFNQVNREGGGDAGETNAIKDEKKRSMRRRGSLFVTKELLRKKSFMKYSNQMLQGGAISKRLGPESITLFGQWAAHSDSIGKMRILSDPPSLLTCSYDRVVKVWDLHKGFLTGTLYQGSSTIHGVDKAWMFYPNSTMRVQLELDQARDVLQRVRSEREEKAQALERAVDSLKYRRTSNSHMLLRLANRTESTLSTPESSLADDTEGGIQHHAFITERRLSVGPSSAAAADAASSALSRSPRRPVLPQSMVSPVFDRRVVRIRKLSPREESAANSLAQAFEEWDEAP